MSILVDVILVIIFLLIVIFFTRFGLDKALYKLGKTWLVIACSFIIGPIITNFLEDLFITNLVTNAVHSSLIELIENNANGYNLAELFASMPQGFVNFLDSFGASLSALEAEFGSYTEASSEIIATMATRIATPCVNTLSSIIGQILGIIIPWAFFKWMSYELKKDSKHSFFRFFDYVGGFIVGVILGYLAVMGLAVLTKTIFQVIIAFNSEIQVMPIYENSFIFKFVADFNIFKVVAEFFQSISTSVQTLMK